MSVLLLTTGHRLLLTDGVSGLLLQEAGAPAPILRGRLRIVAIDDGTRRIREVGTMGSRLNATIGNADVVRRVTLVDGSNAGVDLTGVTSVDWDAVGRTSGRVITGAATVHDATAGVIDITLTGAHLDPDEGAIPEVMEMHVDVTWAGGPNPETFPSPGAYELRLDPR